MASSRQLITSQTLSGSAASVTFSGIPSTYTDLCFNISARGTYSSNGISINLAFNGTTANHSDTWLRLKNTTVSGSQDAPGATMFLGYQSSALDTTNVFGNGQIYIPSYTASQGKPVMAFNTAENNDANDSGKAMSAGLWNNTAAITQVVFTLGADNFAAGSSFYLFGIKNS